MTQSAATYQLRPGDRLYFLNGAGFRLPHHDRPVMLTAMGMKLTNTPATATVLVAGQDLGDRARRLRVLRQTHPVLANVPVLTEDQLLEQARARKAERKAQRNAQREGVRISNIRRQNAALRHAFSGGCAHGTPGF